MYTGLVSLRPPAAPPTPQHVVATGGAGQARLATAAATSRAGVFLSQPFGAGYSSGRAAGGCLCASCGSSRAGGLDRGAASASSNSRDAGQPAEHQPRREPEVGDGQHGAPEGAPGDGRRGDRRVADELRLRRLRGQIRRQQRHRRCRAAARLVRPEGDRRGQGREYSNRSAVCRPLWSDADRSLAIRGTGCGC